MIRPYLKSGISAALAWSGGAAVIGHATGKRRLPLIVGYHRVVNDYAASSRHAIDPSLVSVRTMGKQLDWIGRHYDLCSLDEVHSSPINGTRRNKPRAAITFDDGYADVFHNAFPFLQKKGIPFAVFATTDLVGSRDLFAHDELYLRLSYLLSEPEGAAARLGQMLRRVGCWNAISSVFPAASCEPYRLTRAMLGTFRQAEIRTIIEILRSHTELPESVIEQSRVMDWDMLQRMHREGVVIGCHSKSHAILTSEDDATVLSETRKGKVEIEDRLGGRVEHFAYPDGAFDAATINAVARAGYRYAYTVCFHRSSSSPQFTVPRRMLWEQSNVNALGKVSHAIMACQVNGVFDANMACGSTHG